MRADQVPRCNPSFLGPLTDEPVVTTGPSRCFEGEERYFSKSKIDDRERMWHAIAPHLVSVLDDDVHIIAASVRPDDLEQFEPEVETLVQTAMWRPIEP
jgi:hypothetical protein